MVQQDDRVRRETDALGDGSLAEVLMRGVAATGSRVEPEAILARRVERVSIRARPAVPVAHIDDDARSLERVLDGRPRRVRGVDLGDVRRVPTGDRRRRARLGSVPVGRCARGPDDQDDLRNAGRRWRGERADRRDHPDAKHGDQETDDHPSHDSLHSTSGNPQWPAAARAVSPGREA